VEHDECGGDIWVGILTDSPIDGLTKGRKETDDSTTEDTDG